MRRSRFTETPIVAMLQEAEAGREVVVPHTREREARDN